MKVDHDQIINIRLPQLPEEDAKSEPMALDIKMCREVAELDKRRGYLLECLNELASEPLDLEASFVNLTEIHTQELPILPPRFV